MMQLLIDSSIFCLLISYAVSFAPAYKHQNSRWLKIDVEVGRKQSMPSIFNWRNGCVGNLKMSQAVETEVVADTSVLADAVPTTSSDFSKYKIGQQYDATLLSVKKFGAFARISNGKDVLLPRTLLSTSAVEKFNKMAEQKSKDIFKIEIVGLSAENQTLSGRYVVPNVNVQFNIPYNATVTGVHEFGVFAMIDVLEVDGLIPASKLQMKPSEISGTFRKGQQIEIQVLEFKQGTSKLILKLNSDTEGGSSSLSDQAANPQMWLDGVVESVTKVGLFVRPAGQDITGLVHVSKLPKELLKALKAQKTVDPKSAVSEVEQLFHAGDIVKVRCIGSNPVNKRMDLSMLKYVNEDDEDDYVVEGRDTEEQLEEDMELEEELEEVDTYNPLATLVWWNGAPFEFAVEADADDASSALSEEEKIFNENSKTVEGTWRRLFDMDMQGDAENFEQSAEEQEMQEVEEEIGSLMGMDDEFTDDSIGIRTHNTRSVGTAIPLSAIPEHWRSELNYYKSYNDLESEKNSLLRGGKKKETELLDAFFRELEQLDNAEKKSRKPRNSNTADLGEDVPAPGPKISLDMNKANVELDVPVPVVEIVVEAVLADAVVAPDA